MSRCDRFMQSDCAGNTIERKESVLTEISSYVENRNFFPAVVLDLHSETEEELDSEFDCFTPARESPTIPIYKFLEMPSKSEQLDNHYRDYNEENREDSQNQKNNEETPAAEELTIPADIAAMYTLDDTYIQKVTGGCENYKIKEVIESADALISTLTDCETVSLDSPTLISQTYLETVPESPRVIPDSCPLFNEDSQSINLNDYCLMEGPGYSDEAEDDADMIVRFVLLH